MTTASTTTQAASPVGLKGVNWSQYASWPSFVGADGHTYYIPPGGQGYAYDPFLHHLFQDGRAAKADADKTAQDQQDAVKKANSPATQLGTLGAATGATVGIPILANHYFPTPLQQAQTNALLPKVPGVVNNANVAAQGAQQGAAQGVQGAGNAVASGIDPATGEAVQSIQPGTNIVQSVGSDAGAAPTAGIGFGQIAGAAGAAYGGYQTYQALQNGGKGLPMAGAELGAGIGTYALPGLGTAAGAAVGGLAGYGVQNQDNIKGEAALAALGPLGWAYLAAHKLGGLNLIHETTKQTQAKQVSDLASRSDDPAWQSTINALGQSVANGPADPTKPFSDGQGNSFATFQEYKNSPNGLNASNLASNPANLDLYGPDFVKLTLAQQQAITQANINDDNYDDKKGAIVIKDPTKAKANYDSIVASGGAGASPAVTTSAGTAPVGGVAAALSPTVASGIIASPVATTRPATITPAPLTAQGIPIQQLQHLIPIGNINAAAQAAMPRSTTRSPGVLLNGQRIQY